MCYETTLSKKRQQIERHYNINFAVPLEFEPYYHLSGFTNPNLQIVKMNEPDKIYPASWGLIPDWGMDDISAFRKKYNTLNARSENLFSSGTYKKSANEKRCLILADGFFEPHKQGKASIPNFCYIPTTEFEDGRDFFMYAGLYSEIEEDIFTCSIITTEANTFFAEIHNVKKRMPLVLEEELINEWFNDSLSETNVTELMKHGFTHKDFKAHPVSRNLYKRDVDTNTANILEPVKQDGTGTLF